MSDGADGRDSRDPAGKHTPGMEELEQRLQELEEREVDLVEGVKLDSDDDEEAYQRDLQEVRQVRDELAGKSPDASGSDAGPEAEAERPHLKLESSSAAPRRPKVSEPPAEFPKKVAIIGSASGWELAPFDDPSWNVWSLSRMYHSLPRWDVWFEIHPWDRLCERRDGTTPQNEQLRLKAEYQHWLSQDHGRPIFMQQHYPQVPGCLVYPLDAIRQTFPGDDYFTNSVSYMLALAIFQGVERIGIWGVDMATAEEYHDQRPGVEYWVGLARGAGITVDIPATSDLCKSRVLYGWYADPMHDKLTLKLDHAMRGIKEAENHGRQAELALANARGAKQILEWMLRNY